MNLNVNRIKSNIVSVALVSTGNKNETQHEQFPESTREMYL